MTKPSPTTDVRTPAGMMAAVERLLPNDPAGQRKMVRDWFRGSAADADLNDEHTRNRVYATAEALIPLLGEPLPKMVALVTEREETR